MIDSLRLWACLCLTWAIIQLLPGGHGALPRAKDLAEALGT